MRRGSRDCEPVTAVWPGANLAPDQVVAQLEHPNIVPLHALGLDEQGRPFYTMKLVRGVTLREVLEALLISQPETVRQYPLASLLTVFQKVCDAVAFAHSRRVIHRDLKPANIMLGEYGEVLVMDWGLAKVLANDRDPVKVGRPVDGDGTAAGSDPAQTLEGHVLGTPNYMSPEQASGQNEHLDERSDIFALGAVLYHLLVLRPPFMGKTAGEVLARILEGEVTPPDQVRTGEPRASDRSAAGWPHCPGGLVPPALSAVVMKALATRPEDRYPTVRALQQDISAYQHGFATTAERATPWKLLRLAAKRRKAELSVAAAALLVLAVVIAAFVFKVTWTLAELRKVAPSFMAEAGVLAGERRFAAALEKVDCALRLLPNEAAYHVVRGHLCQARWLWTEAADAYLRAQALGDRSPETARALYLTQKIRTEIERDRQPAAATLRELRQSLLEQERYAEAYALSERIGHEDATELEQWRAQLAQAQLRGVLEYDRTHPEGLLSLTLTEGPTPDISALRGLPLTRLVLGHEDTVPHVACLVRDLSPLRGMPLRALRIYGSPVADLTPLRGLPLEELHLKDMKEVTDLGPLRGMRLKGLVLSVLPRLRDLGPLRGMPLEVLALNGSPLVTDLSPVRGAPFIYVSLIDSGVSDLSPLANSPLGNLILMGCQNVADLSPLTNLVRLDHLVIPRQCENLEPLRGLPMLKRLGYDLPGFALSNITSAEQFWREWDAREK